MSTVRVCRKGEVLYREGEKAASVFFIQSGSVHLTLHRQKQTIDLATLGANQVAGEHGMVGVINHPHTATAFTECKVVEFPIETVKAQIELASPTVKSLSKALLERAKVLSREVQSYKLGSDSTPCPPEQTAKIFASLYYAARAKGKTEKDGSHVVPWPVTRQYAQRVFIESPKRLEMATNIFVKLGWAKYAFGKDEENPDGPEIIQTVTFTDLGIVESFFEFYQYYHFKGGAKAEVLKVDDRMERLVALLLEFAEGQKLDRHGMVRLDYAPIVEKAKKTMNLQLNTDHFSLLEQKGLFVKRQSHDNGIWLDFEPAEFKRTVKIWKVLKEIVKWNEKGLVDLNEAPEELLAAANECPGCHKPFQAAQKFCAECGAKLPQAAA